MTQNGYANAHLDAFSLDGMQEPKRFSDIPDALDIPVSGADTQEAVEVDLLNLPDDPDELCTLLDNERAAKRFWVTIALAFAKGERYEMAIEILNRGLASLSRGDSKDKLELLACMCWIYLWKCRTAPRTVPEGQLVSEAKTKDYYLQACTSTLNEASRLNPSFAPLFLARGVLYLTRASLQPPAKTLTHGSVENSERTEGLRSALKCFEDALRTSVGKNEMAILGKARAQYCLGRYSEALEGYQNVLANLPNLKDPDPRIGIGCCLWHLNFRDEARAAWARAAEVVSWIIRMSTMKMKLKLTHREEPYSSRSKRPPRCIPFVEKRSVSSI